eukprot:Rmarinus@m.23078
MEPSPDGNLFEEEVDDLDLEAPDSIPLVPLGRTDVSMQYSDRKTRTRILLAAKILFECILVYGGKSVYGMVRNNFGSAAVSPQYALSNAESIIAFERSLGFFWEQEIQLFFLEYRTFIKAMDIYYGLLHFLASTCVLIYIFIFFHKRYYLWRTVFLTTTMLSLIGFACFPLMPPRLLNVCDNEYGGCATQYTFVDTLEEVGGFWSWRSKRMNGVSNHYAAMPSVHTSWSVWCALAMYPVVRPMWARVVCWLYPMVTIFCIVVTANHYIMDAVGGLMTIFVGYHMSVYLNQNFTSRPVRDWIVEWLHKGWIHVGRPAMTKVEPHLQKCGVHIPLLKP